jgi:putative ABC transport system permease protein
LSPTYIELGLLEVGLAAALVGVNLLLSAALRLGMGKRLVIASVRMTAQLLLVGLILQWVFALREPISILALCLVMTVLAGVSAVRRTSRRYPGIFWNSLVSVLGGCFIVTGVAVAGIIRVDPWYEPQYLIPLLGMVLGNALTGISLGLDRFMDSLVERRAEIETRLALGATRWEAAHEEVRRAVRTGMIPIVNSMMVMGVVSLPGMMTGQILAGADPAHAVRYQAVIVFMIASAIALSTLTVVLLAFSRLFDAHHRLRWELIKKART